MNKLSSREVYQAILKKHAIPKNKTSSMPFLKRKYPNWNVRYGEIVNFAYKLKEKNPNFDDVKSLPVKLKLKKIRIPAKIEAVR